MTIVQSPPGSDLAEGPDRVARRGAACEMIDGVLYPYEEEEPVVQGNWHAETVIEIVNCAQGLFADRPDTGIFTDIFVFWWEGDSARKFAPDLIILPSIEEPERERKSVYLWQEKSRPIFVVEVYSPKTAEEDTGPKMELYQNELKIPEYFLCRRLAQMLDIWGYRLMDGEYQPIEPDKDGRIFSEQLEAWAGSDEKGRFQFWDKSGRVIAGYARVSEQAREEAARAKREAARAKREAERARREARRAAKAEELREKAEARVRELEEELRRRAS
ncbi:MAG TPA: Uma2 family endonuclease [Armatimonadota bacterium]|nr:Uma2 family endonuclease [Armatimonadota bacterium]